MQNASRRTSVQFYMPNGQRRNIFEKKHAQRKAVKYAQTLITITSVICYVPSANAKCEMLNANATVESPTLEGAIVIQKLSPPLADDSDNINKNSQSESPTAEPLIYKPSPTVEHSHSHTHSK